MLQPYSDKDVSISIIVPVYNVEQYLEETLLSALCQTLSTIEIICINDGSTDASGMILNAYAQKDNRLIVMEQQNSGQSIARNKALKIAKGEYVYFLDSDDLLSSDAMMRLYNIAKCENLDIVLFDGDSFYETKELEAKHLNYKTAYHRRKSYPNVLQGKLMYAQMVQNGDYKVSPCLQLIRRDFLNAFNIQFYEGIIHEDNLFSFYCLMEAERVFHIKERLFFRRVRANSVMTSKRGKKNYIGYYTCIYEILNYVHTNNLSNDLIVQINRQLCGYLSSLEEIYQDLDADDQLAVETTYPFYCFDILKVLRDEINSKKAIEMHNTNLVAKNEQQNIPRNMTKTEMILQYYDIDSFENHKILKVFLYLSRKAVGGIRCYHENGFVYTVKRFFVKLKKKIIGR